MIDTVHAYTLPRLNFVRFRTGKESSGDGKLCACAYRVGSLHRVAIEGPPTALKGTPLTRVRRGWDAVAQDTIRRRLSFFRLQSSASGLARSWALGPGVARSHEASVLMPLIPRGGYVLASSGIVLQVVNF